jgi:hydroxypyruvate isomerase
MPRFAANLSLMYTETGFLDRFAAAAASGFGAVEYQFPYAFDRRDLAAAAREARLPVVLHNTPPGDFDKGERGLGSVPGRQAEFRDQVTLAIDYARAVGCARIHVMAGIWPDGAKEEDLNKVFVENLRHAGKEAAKVGIDILIEPLSRPSVPNYFLVKSKQAIRLMDEARVPNLYLQYDAFHMQVMEGNLCPTIERHLKRIGHIQIADTPGRNEPGTGEINYPFLLGHIERVGYTGWIGAEYKPAGETKAGLGWFQSYRASQPLLIAR